MNSRVALATMLVLSCAVPLSRAAAQAPLLEVGDRVRVTVPAVPLRGTQAIVSGLAADTLRVAVGPAVHAVRWQDVAALDRRQRRTRTAGARLGGKRGLAVGVVLGLISLATPKPAGEDFSEPALAAEAVLDGLLVGALIGALRPGWEWRGVDIATARASAPDAQARHAARVAADSVRTASWKPRADSYVDVLLGFNFPQVRYAQFPGLSAALAVNVVRNRTYGASLVGEGDISYLRSAVMGGVRITRRPGRFAPGPARTTYFAQLVAGQVNGEQSGVVHSTGGFAVQPGVGVNLGAGPVAFHVQLDYRSVPGGFVYNDRVPGRPVDALSDMRVVAGTVFRLGPP